MANGRALADAIKQAASEHYGHAGRAFLERLTHDARDFGAFLETFKHSDEFAIRDASGQEARASGRLALIALAGELATEYELTDWPEGAATEAAAEGLRVWLAYRSKGNAEPAAILQAIHDFIDRHGDSRFSDFAIRTETPLIRDRAGWWRQDSDKREYLFTGAGLRDACRGHDFDRVVTVLAEKGVIPAKG